MLLSKLPLYKPASITTVETGPDAGVQPEIANRLRGLGFYPGSEVIILHRAAMGGDPLALRIDGIKIGLSLELARLVRVEPIDG